MIRHSVSNLSSTAVKIIASIIFFVTVAIPDLVFSDEVKQRSLTVAALLGLTGDAAVHSANIRKGVELAAEELKSRGWKVSLRFEDDQTNAAKTVTTMQMLISNGYKLFIGPTWDFQVNAIRGIVPKRNIVAIAPAVTASLSGGPIAGVFNLAPPRENALPQLVAWLKAKGVHRAFILAPNGPWGEIHRGLLKKAMEEAGGAIVGDESFDYGIDASTTRALMLKAKKSNADVLFTTGASGDSANIVRARNALGINAVILGTDDLQDAANLKLLTKDDIKGDVFTITGKIASSFVSRYRTRYGEEPGFYADGGYDALMTLAQATERTDGSPEAIRSLLLSGAQFEGGSGSFGFDEHGDIRDGVFELKQVSP